MRSSSFVPVRNEMMMSLDDALDACLSFIDTIEQGGIALVLQNGLLQSIPFERALHTLKEMGNGASVAELIADAMRRSALSNDNGLLVQLEAELIDGNGDVAIAKKALLRFVERFTEATLILKRVSDMLGAVPQIVSAFGRSIRCALLEADLLSPFPACREHLRELFKAHAQHLLETLEVGGPIPSRDEVLVAINRLGLSSTGEMQALWRELLHVAVVDKVACTVTDVDKSAVMGCVEWKERVLDRFVVLILQETFDSSGFRGAHDSRTVSAIRFEIDRWNSELEQALYLEIGRRRIQDYWDILLEFPASIPACEDLQFCFSRYKDRSLLNELVVSAKRLLASKLHRAGTSTKMILEFLVRAMRSLCHVLTKHEQSTVFAIVGDTLTHLRSRKDSVACIVADLMLPSDESTVLPGDEPVDAHQAHANGSDDDLPDGSEATWRGSQQPQVLRALLATLSLRNIVDECKEVLSHRLLIAREMHNFDIMQEMEVLERLKVVFGEDMLAECAVMIKDMQSSRRNQKLMAEEMGRMPSSSNQLLTTTHTTTIISATCWPKVPSILARGCPSGPLSLPLTFRPHPMFVTLQERQQAAFHKGKPSQRLVFMDSLSRARIQLVQRDSSGQHVQRSWDLPLFIASAVLIIKSNESPMPLTSLAQHLEVTEPVLIQALQAYHPFLVLIGKKGDVRLQTSIVEPGSVDEGMEEGAVAGGGAAEVVADEAKISGFSNEEVEKLTKSILAMLKARGTARPLAEVHNSLKMFFKFDRPAADLKRVMLYLVEDGKLSTADGGATFALVKPAAPISA